LANKLIEYQQQILLAGVVDIGYSTLESHLELVDILKRAGVNIPVYIHDQTTSWGIPVEQNLYGRPLPDNSTFVIYGESLFAESKDSDPSEELVNLARAGHKIILLERHREDFALMESLLSDFKIRVTKLQPLSYYGYQSFLAGTQIDQIQLEQSTYATHYILEVNI
jgi:hypothetical protein